VTIKVNYTLADGTVRVVDGQAGDSVMDTAVKNSVPGIVAECGGALACATCHVYVDDRFLELVGEPDEFEDELLDGAMSERKPSSRLSCQITLSEELDALTVEVPPTQV
jgi:ferredoxin, 2Fe-2S